MLKRAKLRGATRKYPRILHRKGMRVCEFNDITFKRVDIWRLITYGQMIDGKRENRVEIKEKKIHGWKTRWKAQACVFRASFT